MEAALVSVQKQNTVYMVWHYDKRINRHIGIMIWDRLPTFDCDYTCR